jgi:Flp pilus assembly protein TadD
MSATTTTRQQRRLEAIEGYLLLGMSEQALREIDSLRGSGCDSIDICRLRGEALRDLRRHDEALGEFRAADEREPGDLTTLMGMAWCLKRIDQLDGALETMLRAYQSHPEEPVVLYNIACYLTLSGDKAQALSWLGRALRMEPGLRKLIPDESDFDSLRNDPDFQFIIADPRDETEES